MRAIGSGLVAAFGAVALGLVLTACGSDSGDGSTTSTTGSPQVVFNVNLTGAAEVPGPGAADGRGTARITVDPQRDEVCFELQVSNVSDVTAAHINQGSATVAGPVVVTLTTPQNGRSEGCLPVPAATVQSIASGRTSYYVNVQSTQYPAGAVRAQLTG